MTEDEPHTASDAEVTLTGGNMSSVARRGGAVHRSAGAWTPTVHRLLQHLHSRGVTWLPRPLGMDDEGREVLTYLPGVVPTYPLPDWVWAEEVLVTAATWLSLTHQASAGFDTAGATWQLPAHEPAEVICLNDVAPYNMVFDETGRLSGWIDVDVASPGPRMWDLAYLAYRLVPLTEADDTGAGALDLGRCHRRLSRLCEAYVDAGGGASIAPAGVLRVAVERLEDLAEFTAARATAGAEHVASHVALYRRDAAWITSHAPQLVSP